ncbi:hypothetical protein [Chlamydiifrater phoenicopteri]|uniref:hypothetical protein n=1 Tax=Chlamydiifrater phoenicopteri TaxID=2681469 RepID=UPI001BCBBAA3|nr:hypothetical protein [Chlamydiifrater phoenicopteri]
MSTPSINNSFQSPSPLEFPSTPPTNSSSNMIGRFPQSRLLEEAPITELEIIPLQRAPSTGISGKLFVITDKIGEFLKANWKHILLYMLAWALILACHFTVAITLTVWLCIGFAAGIVIGIVSATLLDKENKNKEINSLWNLLNHGITQLDQNGTRQVLLATMVASISGLIYMIPEVVGFIIGTCIGNQISIQACYGIQLGKESVRYLYDPEAFEQRTNSIRHSINECQIFRNLLINQEILTLLLKKYQSSSPEESLTHTVPIKLTGLMNRIYDFSEPSAPKPISLDNPKIAIELLEKSILALSVRLASITETPDRIVEDES